MDDPLDSVQGTINPQVHQSFSAPPIAAIVTPTDPDDSELSPEVPLKRGRGRPKGSKNKVHPEGSPSESSLPKRPRGRPRKESGPPPDPDAPKRPRGRPRKDGLPAGSVNSKKSGQEPTSAISQQLAQSVVTAPLATIGGFESVSVFKPPSHNPIPAPVTAAKPAETLPARFSIKQSVAQPDNWENNPTHAVILTDLVTTLSALYPVDIAQVDSLSPMSPQNIFSIHLQSLSSMATSPYRNLSTFWLPHSQAYFALIGNVTSQAPPSVNTHRFFYWDPFSLVMHGLACPDCRGSLRHEGLCSSGPIAIHDLESRFFIIGASYTCTSSTCGHKYQSTHPKLIDLLPQPLRNEFPAILVPDEQPIILPGQKGKGKTKQAMNSWNWSYRGVSRSLWSVAVGSLEKNMSKSDIVDLLKTIRKGVPFDSRVNTPNMEEEDEDMTDRASVEASNAAKDSEPLSTTEMSTQQPAQSQESQTQSTGPPTSQPQQGTQQVQQQTQQKQAQQQQEPVQVQPLQTQPPTLQLAPSTHYTQSHPPRPATFIHYAPPGSVQVHSSTPAGSKSSTASSTPATTTGNNNTSSGGTFLAGQAEPWQLQLAPGSQQLAQANGGYYMNQWSAQTPQQTAAAANGNGNGGTKRGSQDVSGSGNDDDGETKRPRLESRPSP